MNQKNPRRKRKDPQSRDFTCRCGKNYLSYAAAYTHVKNKHKLEKQFLDTIGKPQREKLRRGRPKEKKQLDNNAETQSLSIIEQTILKIYTELSPTQPNIILEGNEDVLDEHFQLQFQNVIAQNPHIILNIEEIDHLTKLYANFTLSLNKHFEAVTAAKIKFLVYYIAKIRQEEVNEEEDETEEEEVKKAISKLQFWGGASGVNEIIFEALMKWMSIFVKGEGGDDK